MNLASIDAWVRFQWFAFRGEVSGWVGLKLDLSVLYCVLDVMPFSYFLHFCLGICMIILLVKSLNTLGNYSN